MRTGIVVVGIIAVILFLFMRKRGKASALPSPVPKIQAVGSTTLYEDGGGILAKVTGEHSGIAVHLPYPENMKILVEAEVYIPEGHNVGDPRILLWYNEGAFAEGILYMKPQTGWVPYIIGLTLRSGFQSASLLYSPDYTPASGILQREFIGIRNVKVTTS